MVQMKKEAYDAAMSTAKAAWISKPGKGSLGMNYLNASPLHMAALQGDLDFVKTVLEEIPQLAEAIDSRNQTPLHMASAEGHIDIVKELVSADVDTCTYQDIRGRNPLHVAVMKGYLGVVKELLVKSANVADMCTARDLGGRNPVHAAAMSGKIDLMKELLEACLLAAQGRVDQDQTILHLCVEQNQLEALELLLNYPKLQELVNAKDAHGNTALHLAVAQATNVETPLDATTSEGHIKVIKTFVCVTVNMCASRDLDGRNPLHVAVMKGYLGVVKELVKSANVADMCTARDLGGRNPVHAAAMSGKIDLMKELLEACLLAAQGRVDQDQTILHLCVEHNQLEALELLLSYPKLQELVNAKDAHGNTALHLAVAQATNVETPLDTSIYEGHIKVIKTLVGVSVNVCASRDLDGRNPLHVAVMKGHLGVVKEVVNSANIADMCTSRDLGGRNPLHAAAMNGKVDILVELLTACSLAAQERGERDQTILHLTVKHNQLRALELLLGKPELQELVNAKDADGNTALHLAVAQAINIGINVIKTLVGVSVNMCACRDLDGRNPLHIAVMKGHLDIVQELVKSANVADMCTSCDHGGRNPLHVAAINGKIDLMTELLKACPLAAQVRVDRDQTILHLCVEHNQLEALKLLLRNPKLQQLGNAKDADGNTALHLAVARATNVETPLDATTSEGHIKVIKTFVCVTVNMCASRDLDGRNPLHVAVMKGYLGVVKELVKSANVADMCTARDLGGRNPVHAAAMSGKIDLMKELLEACLLAAQGRVDQDQTILHLCVEHNQLEALELLLSYPKLQELVNAKDAHGNTALHLAVAQATNVETPLDTSIYEGHIKVIKTLVGVSVNVCASRDLDGRNPLHVAVMKGHLGVVKEVVNSANIADMCTSRDLGGRNPLHAAAMNGKVDILVELLTACSLAAQERGERDQTILHLTVKHNQLRALELLLGKPELQELVNAKDADGNTALHLAVAQAINIGTPLDTSIYEGKINVIKTLVGVSVNMCACRDLDGRNPLHIAVMKGHLDIVQELVKSANVADMCTSCDHGGRNPLHVAAINGKIDLMTELLKACPLAAQVRVDRDQTILHLCVEHNQLEALKLLLRNPKLQQLGNAKDADGNTALHLAVARATNVETPLDTSIYEGHIKVIKTLVGVSVNMCVSHDLDGRNPLHVAVMKGHLGVVKELVNSANAADMCMSRDLGGRNPLHAAAMNGKVDVLVELLTACSLAAQERGERDQTILHMSVKHNQLRAIELLLGKPELQELVNAKDADGNTVLHLAVAQAINIETPLDTSIYEGHIKVIKRLVGVSVNMCASRDLDGRNPLHVAVMKGRLDIVKELVVPWANVADMCTSCDHGGRNPLHVAAINGKIDLITELLNACPLAAQVRVDRDQTILHLCVEHNQLEGLKLLLRNPKLQQLVNAKDADGNTALHLAVSQATNVETPLDTSIYEGHIKVIKTLVGVSVNMCVSHDLDGRNPLHVAVMKGHLGVVKELVNSANAADMCMSCDLGGRNPLHAAAMNGKVDVLVELLTACSLAAQERGERDQTILHMSVKHNQLRAIELLLGKPELQELVNAKDADGNTVLHLAVAHAINIETPLDTSIYEGHIKVIKRLVGVSVNMCASRDLDGRNPLHVAVMKGRLDIVKELVVPWANVADMCTSCDHGGRNPLHVAAINGKIDLITELLNACPLAAQVRVDRDQTILHLCVEHNQLEGLKLLLRNPKLQQLVNAKDADGNTALHLAVSQATNVETPLDTSIYEGQIDVIKTLVGVSVNMCASRDLDGRNPLHIAVMKGHLDIVQELVKSANVADMCTSCDHGGRNPLHVAAINGKIDLITELLKACPLAAQVRVDRDQTILHLCVEHNQLEALELLLRNPKLQQLGNAKDAHGNTALHLAVSQATNVEIVEALCCGNIDMDARNMNGQTALNMLPESEPKRRGNINTNLQPQVREEEERKERIKGFMRVGGALRAKQIRSADWMTRKKDSLMVVAALIATGTFQIGMNPPDSLKREKYFVLNNAIAFAESLFAILLIASDYSRRSWFLLSVQTCAIAVSGSCMALTYATAVNSATTVKTATPPDNKVIKWISNSLYIYSFFVIFISLAGFFFTCLHFGWERRSKRRSMMRRNWPEHTIQDSPPQVTVSISNSANRSPAANGTTVGNTEVLNP